MTSVHMEVPSFAADSALSMARLPAEAERIATTIVAAQLRTLYADEAGVCRPELAFASQPSVRRRWLDATMRLLQAQAHVVGDTAREILHFAPIESLDTLWRQWDSLRASDTVHEHHRAYLDLIEACLRGLSGILTGEVPATDVMFPGSSMHMVEGIYKHNLIADHFNAVLRESLRAECATRAGRGEQGLRLLEIGAGTGGTTAALLPMLREFGDLVAEYRYTDLSRAFLIHAEAKYAPEFPALKTAIFDVCRPLVGQAIEPAHYDVVIATNVLHATPDMRETVRNAKAALRRGGLLLVNEISEWSWHTHFTFGLLDGWWLYRDEPLRLPGSPGLSPESWARLLASERYLDVHFPAAHWHGLGQQIIAARSDGVVRQRLLPASSSTGAAAPQTVASPAPAPATPVATRPARTAGANATPARTRSNVRATASGTEASTAPITLSTLTTATVATDDTALRAACAALFTETIAAALRLDAREIETHRPLEYYGLDSILVVQLTTHFRKLFPEVRSTLFFEVQSIDGLVGHFFARDRDAVLALLAARGHAVGAPVVETTTASTTSIVSRPATVSGHSPVRGARRTTGGRLSAGHAQDRPTDPPIADRPEANGQGVSSVDPAAAERFDVAIIGVSGRYPQSPDLDRFWDNLAAGRNCTGEIPADRWRWQDHFDPEKGLPGKSYTRWGGFIDDVDKFDPLFFRIAPKEAKRIDPQERLFLETSYHAIEDSGYTPDTLSPNRKVGVFVGVMNARYTVQPLYYSIANRVSFLFDFTGPSFAVDSACSSSLTAIHIALDNLRNGLCDVAIAGGVSLILDPQHMLELTAVGMLSEGPHCRSFGQDADGFVDAEGVGAVVLKPLAAALRDGDNIHAVIRGSALNAGGRTHGYTVPNPAAQAEVVADALARAGVDAADVSYLEAHGTGTALGDPIEVAGLTRAFNSHRDHAAASGRICAIGSLKSNIGHCESAAGIAALTKVLLQLRHGQLVPTLHAERVNDEIDFEATPFRLQRTLAPWRRPRDETAVPARELPRIAGISSFGAGGANAHLVVQEAPVEVSSGDHATTVVVSGPCLVPLSARNPAQLDARIRALLDFLDRPAALPSLVDIAYTLQVGREAMDERVVLIVSSIDDLRERLRALLENPTAQAAAARGNARQDKAFVAECRNDPAFAARRDDWFARRDLAALATHWARGVDLDWSRLHAGARRRRVSLPAYPFARERHWIDPQRTLGTVPGAGTATVHPLLQRNLSTLRHPGYGVALKGDEAFLAVDADGRRRLSLPICAEMARAAIAAACPDDLEARELHLEQVVVDIDATIEGACDLRIVLFPDDDDQLRFEIDTRQGDAVRVHCQGSGRFVPTGSGPGDALPPTLPVERRDPVALKARLAEGVDGEGFHARLAAHGLSVPIAERIIRRAVRDGHTWLFEWSQGEVAASMSSPTWGLSPDHLAAIERGIAQAIVWASDAAAIGASQTADWRIDTVDWLRCVASPERAVHAVLRIAEGQRHDDAGLSLSFVLLDAQGQPLWEARAMRVVPATSRESVTGQVDRQGDHVAVGRESLAQATHASTAMASAPARPVDTAIAPVLTDPVSLDATGERIPFARGALPVSRQARAASSFVAASVAKPDAIRLDAPGDAPPGVSTSVVSMSAGRPLVALSTPDVDLVVTGRVDPTPGQTLDNVVELRRLAGGAYALSITQPQLTPQVVADLVAALAHLRTCADARVLLIEGGASDFLHGDETAFRHAVDAGLFRALVACPAVTLAAVRGDCTGAGLVSAALCDLLVVDRDGRFAIDALSSDTGSTGLAPSPDLHALLATRFGDARADDLLFIGAARDGRTLETSGAGFRLVERSEVRSTALTLAADLVARPQVSLRLLKQHMARDLADCVSRLDATASTSTPSALPEHASATTDTITLPVTGAGLALATRDAGVVSLRLLADGKTSATEQLQALHAALGDLATCPGLAALVLCSEHPGFLPDIDAADSQTVGAVLDLLIRSVEAFPAPVIVAFEHAVDGEGWRLGLAADASVYTETSRCSVDALWARPASLRDFGHRLAVRHGEECARRVLLGEEALSGDTFARLACAPVAADAAATLARAEALAAMTPLRMRDRLAAWRSHDAMRRAASHATVTATPPRAGDVASLPSCQVLETELRDDGVLVVRMVERGAKNMFSPELIHGLEAVFAHVQTNPACRAVVLCGYDTYFACGGTRDSLLAIQQGSARFTDTRLYQLPMDCRVPVIAAMQGHAIGGGWSFGMFADVRLFSAESRYISPYMRYGFTPGAGSTLVFPTTLGFELARETLLTAGEYSGSALRSRGLQDVCLPRGEVFARALAIAGSIAARPVDLVAELKCRLVTTRLARIEDVYARELAMHEQSFVGNATALDGVMRHFLDEEGAGAAMAQSVDDAAISTTVRTSDARGPVDSTTVNHDVALVGPSAEAIGETLKSMLAAELQMDVAQIDEDTPFIDLGLDSITGVTWVRRINAHYGTRIEATKVYSHPDLRQFREHVCALVAKDLPASPATPAPAVSAPASTSPVVAQPAIAATSMPGSASTAAGGLSDADLRAELRRLLAQELHLDEREIDEQRQFIELGLDSITGVTWVRRINAVYGTRIEATKVYSHPTLEDFARFVAESLPQDNRPASSVDTTPTAIVASRPAAEAATHRVALRTAPRTARALRSWRNATSRPGVSNDRAGRARPGTSGPQVDTPIAVIGMAGRFPQAPDLDAYWRNIAGARDCIETVPATRWDIERYFSADISVPDTTNSRWMGVVPDADAFDPLFFNISPTEAESMDPQQRLMLEHCWHAIEDAAIDPRTLSGSRTGVFIGCGATDYHRRSREHAYSTQGFTGAAMSILAARISYFLNLQGPCLSIDTACSSSLVAIANACDNLVAGHCDTALAGGVAVMAGPEMHIKTGQSAMLSVDGRCFAFDHRANGFVPAEGVGAVLLKRLDDAVRDGDIIHAVIRGWGVNQDGKSNGITAPNPVSQTRLMRAVYDRYGIDPEDIQLVEAHGTGTPLGDPIEVEGLQQAFRHYTDKRGYCTLGSVKSNVGHCLFAAGIAGVLKLTLALRHRQLPPSANFEQINPHIQLDDTPFVVNTSLRDWPTNARGTRTAVVSSFGFSGTNAHLVLEGPPEDARRLVSEPSRPVLVPLSAKSPEQLRQRARDLASFLDTAECAGEAPRLDDVAYTLQIGREAMEERCALVAVSLRDLIERLDAFAEGRPAKAVHVGSTHARSDRLAFLGQDRDLRDVLVDTCVREGKLDKLAELWVDGLDLAWSVLHRDATATDARRPPRRIPLPLYPFARERYWLPDDSLVPATVSATASRLHPLVHANVSTLQAQRYRTVFQGDECFLRDHRVRIAEGRVGRVLPGVAYLEMAAAAVCEALPEQAAAGRLVLSDIAWWRPVVVDSATVLEIDLGVDAEGAIRFGISSLRDGDGGSTPERVLHCQGEATFVAIDTDGDRILDPSDRFDADALENQPSDAASDGVWRSESLYAAFDRVGLHYGPAHRGLRAVARDPGRLRARVFRPAIADDPGGYRLHPGVMDAALQACIGFLPSLDALPETPSVPFALQSLIVHAPCPDDAIVVLRPVSSDPRTLAVTACDVALHAPDGRLCVELLGFRWRAVDAGGQAGAQDDTEHPLSAATTDDTTPDTSVDHHDGFDEAFYIELLDSISKQELSAEAAAELGLMS